ADMKRVRHSIHVVIAAIALMGFAPVESTKFALQKMRTAQPAPKQHASEPFDEARNCLAQAIYFEARSEPYEGWIAVGEVVLNRARSPRYPAHICQVVFQGEENRHQCQFSFACDGRSDRARNKYLWKKAYQLAGILLTTPMRTPLTNTATHYHAEYVEPFWSGDFRKIQKIGKHIFYADSLNRVIMPLARPERIERKL
ncbi:MAG: cell wall hydrolase, partial [Parvibaculales bacterium]